MMTNEKKRKDWERLVADYRASDLSMRAWCEKSGVTFHQLRYWQRKLARTLSSAGWAGVQIVEDSSPVSVNMPGALITVRVGVAAIDIYPGFDTRLLSDVLRVVVSVC